MDDYLYQQLRRLLGRWRDSGLVALPRMPCGARNDISDVAGVTVGHATLAAGDIQTGVTAIVPPGDNLFTAPLPCGAAVLNGFAKPVGLVQVAELGLLQTPILLSNTLAVGTLFTTLVREAIARNPELGRTLPTVNPLALECNDGWLNDIQALAVTEEVARQALSQASEQIARGMSCFGLKGGDRQRFAAVLVVKRHAGRAGVGQFRHALLSDVGRRSIGGRRRAAVAGVGAPAGCRLGNRYHGDRRAARRSPAVTDRPARRRGTRAYRQLLGARFGRYRPGVLNRSLTQAAGG